MMTDERLKEVKDALAFGYHLGTPVGELLAEVDRLSKLTLAEVERLREELAEVERLRKLTTPQPIETAPKDGSPFMALRKSMYGFVSCQTAYFDDDGDCLNEDSVVLEPTHWLHLPKMEVLK